MAFFEELTKKAQVLAEVATEKANFGLAIFDIANHLSHKWKKPDYYLNYACACHQDLPVEFEYRRIWHNGHPSHHAYRC